MLPSFIFLAVAALAQASNVLDLTKPDDFQAAVSVGKPGLVEFFAPWCGHCKNLAPIYEQLADAFAHKKDNVYVAKVDADGEGRETGQKHGVTGFPTLKWFDGEGNTEPYEGGRDLDALAAFITKKTGLKSNIKPPPPPTTLQLDVHNFDEVVMNSDTDVLVAFTAPWCGHCKRMKPELEKVATNFKSESKCLVAEVDADAQKNRPLASKYDVSGFPTLKFFAKGSSSKTAEDYDAGRSAEEFTTFLNEKCGTSRSAAGGLNDLAGRIPELDTIALKFFAAEASARQAVYDEAAAIAASAGATSQHYLKAMQKSLNSTEDYFTKEAARLATILQKKSLSSDKLDQIKIKANVLAAFAQEKAKEAAESAADTAKDSAESVKSAAHHIKEEL